MKLDVYFIDAFADKVFTGNPAAVIFTDINDEKLMQKIASEFALFSALVLGLTPVRFCWILITFDCFLPWPRSF